MFQVILITDWSLPDCVERVKDALRAGPGIAVQHRHPQAVDRQFYEEGLRLKEACGDAPLFINGRLDIALALDAHLHLTSKSLRAADVRPYLGSRWLSASCHPSVEREVEADLLLVSPVFAPISKPIEHRPLGIDAFRSFTESCSTPCFALGGITPDNAHSLGPVAGVAVIGSVLHAPSPWRAAEALLAAIRLRNEAH